MKFEKTAEENGWIKAGEEKWRVWKDITAAAARAGRNIKISRDIKTVPDIRTSRGIKIRPEARTAQDGI